MRKRMLIVIVALVVVFGGVFGYKAFVNYQIGKFMASRQGPPVSVAAIKLQTSPWQEHIRVTGEVEAVQGVAVTSEVAGIVRKIAFDSGDTVAEGDLLVALDTEADRAQLEGLRADAKLARTTLDRKRQLRGRNLGSQADLDQAQAQYQKAQASVKAQEALIAKKTLRAPFAGQLGIRQVNLGQYLAPGEAVTNLQMLDPIYVDFAVPQKRISQIVAGQHLALRVAGYDQSFEGAVEAVSPALERDTRTFTVRARISNEKQRLRPGMYGNVSLEIGKPKPFLTVPQAAISYNPYGDSLWVVVKKGEGKQSKLVAKRQTVRTGDTRGDQVQILDGVKAGQQVVVAGHHKLRVGSTVTIDNDNLPENEAHPKNVKNF